MAKQALAAKDVVRVKEFSVVHRSIPSNDHFFLVPTKTNSFLSHIIIMLDTLYSKTQNRIITTRFYDDDTNKRILITTVLNTYDSKTR